MRKKISLFFISMISVLAYADAPTPAKGLFTVAAGKTVQFANANSVYSESELIQWAHLDDVKAAGWDVLTSDEWTYLLVTRDVGGTSKNNLGTVDGQKGLIILPDAWVQPSGTPEFQPVDEEIAYNRNAYSASEWALMADAGAVFLPCRGYGYNDPLDGNKYKEIDTSDHGSYWAKDQYNADDANCMRFQDGLMSGIHDFNHAVKTNYYCVILVKTVTPTYLDETHNATEFAVDRTAAAGKSYAYVKRTMKKDGTYYTLCLPFDVPNIDASPLAGAEVFTFGGGSVSGSTGNEQLYLQLNRLSGKRLTQGVPYLLRWENTGERIDTLCFYNVENWDDDTSPAADQGNDDVKLRGIYPKTHIPDYTEDPVVAHYNFFLGANNTLYWPDRTLYPTSDMKGFRAYFYINTYPFPIPDPAPLRTMPVVWQISGGFGSATGTEAVTGYGLQVTGTKLFRDGQIILIIDGKEFDLQGKQIK